MSRHRFHVLPLAAGLLAVALMSVAVPTPAGAAELKVRIEGLRSRDGVVRLALYDKEEGFPKKDGKFKGGAVLLADGTDGTDGFVFTQLAPGTYAVSIYHDENANDRFDFTWLGLPKEGYGFSNGARATFGAPSFAEATVSVGDGANAISITLTYW